MIARLVAKLGEPGMIAMTLFVAAVGIAWLPFAATWPMLLIGLAIFAIGSSLTRPPVFGMISQLSSASEQGATMGVNQGASSIARIAGPLFATAVFNINPSYPYIACAVICFITGLLALRCLRVEQSPH
jgi:MFS family permease